MECTNGFVSLALNHLSGCPSHTHTATGAPDCHALVFLCKIHTAPLAEGGCSHRPTLMASQAWCCCSPAAHAASTEVLHIQSYNVLSLPAAASFFCQAQAQPDFPVQLTTALFTFHTPTGKRAWLCWSGCLRRKFRGRKAYWSHSSLSDPLHHSPGGFAAVTDTHGGLTARCQEQHGNARVWFTAQQAEAAGGRTGSSQAALSFTSTNAPPDYAAGNESILGYN